MPEASPARAARATSRRRSLALLGMVGLLLAGIAYGIVIHERRQYAIPVAWQPILTGAVRNRAEIVALLRAQGQTAFADCLELKGFDAATAESGPQRYVELLITYRGGQSEQVDLLCICRSTGLFNHRETTFRAAP